MSRGRSKQATSLRERLVEFAKEAREKAKSAIGAERDELIKKARRADTAAHLDEWASSPGLQSPE
jgi:hypothetical protein